MTAWIKVTVISIDSKITRRQNVASHDSIFTLTATLAEDYATATLALDSKFGNLDSTLCGELILSPKEHSCDSKLCGKSNCLEKDPCSRYLLSQIPWQSQCSRNRRVAVSLSCTKSARLRQKLQALQNKSESIQEQGQVSICWIVLAGNRMNLGCFLCNVYLTC
jgi:hypothetical protein